MLSGHVREGLLAVSFSWMRRGCVVWLRKLNSTILRTFLVMVSGIRAKVKTLRNPVNELLKFELRLGRVRVSRVVEIMQAARLVTVTVVKTLIGWGRCIVWVRCYVLHLVYGFVIVRVIMPVLSAASLLRVRSSVRKIRMMAFRNVTMGGLNRMAFIFAFAGRDESLAREGSPSVESMNANVLVIVSSRAPLGAWCALVTIVWVLRMMNGAVMVN